MNAKEIGEIRRHLRRDRSNIPAIFGCYVNEKKEIISEFRASTAMMSENEAEKYYSILKRTLSGTVGKNLIDIAFKTSQVVSSPEHQMLMQLRETGFENADIRMNFYQKVIDTVSLQSNYLILCGCDNYDVPFRGKNGEESSDRSDESYRYVICGICPVKQTKPALHYVPEEKHFHDGAIINVVSAPELGFLFPAFDNRATNIYNALYYTHSPKENYPLFAQELFQTQIPKPAYEQKKSFEALLSNALSDECSLDVVQTVHEQLCQRIEMHKESRVPDTLFVSKSEVKEMLEDCGVSEQHLAKFSVDYDASFGFEADLHPKNIINDRLFEIKTHDISIKVAPDKADLIETRVIGGIKYILIQADENVEVNGVPVQIEDKAEVTV